MEVKLGNRVVKDVIEGDLLEVEVDLEAEGLAWPDSEWLELFRAYRDFPGDLEEPRLEYGKLHFEAPDEDLQRAWSAIKERVAATNRSYGELLAPRPSNAPRTNGGQTSRSGSRMRKSCSIRSTSPFSTSRAKPLRGLLQRKLLRPPFLHLAEADRA